MAKNIQPFPNILITGFYFFSFFFFNQLSQKSIAIKKALETTLRDLICVVSEAPTW